MAGTSALRRAARRRAGPGRCGVCRSWSAVLGARAVKKEEVGSRRPPAKFTGDGRCSSPAVMPVNASNSRGESRSNCMDRQVSRPRVARTFDLAPSEERPGPVGRVDPLRHDALQARRNSAAPLGPSTWPENRISRCRSAGFLTSPGARAVAACAGPRRRVRVPASTTAAQVLVDLAVPPAADLVICFRQALETAFFERGV
jgi:hypothetical protein